DRHRSKGSRRTGLFRDVSDDTPRTGGETCIPTRQEKPTSHRRLNSGRPTVVEPDLTRRHESGGNPISDGLVGPRPAIICRDHSVLLPWAGCVEVPRVHVTPEPVHILGIGGL